MSRLNQFRFDVLAAISGIETRKETSYGLAIKRELEASEYDDVNHGRLYQSLDALEMNGYITVNSIDGRTNAYELTRKGMGALRDRIGALQDMMDGKGGVEA